MAKRHDWLHATDPRAPRPHHRQLDGLDPPRLSGRRQARPITSRSKFLIGRLLRDALSNLELTEPFDAALRSLEVDLSLVEALEPDAALGNGGLGRLAACFMESLASLDIPAYGYGIRYSHGLFRQMITDGWQTERPEDWLEWGNPWEFPRRESAYRVAFYGHVAGEALADVRQRHFWHHGEALLATAYDTPMVGWRGKRVNTLRLWSARPLDPIHLEAFNVGDYAGALADHNRAEIITRVLYPADSTPQGQELRLRQEYFFTSASLQDIIRRHLQSKPRPQEPRRQGGDPAERHASGHRGCRNDASPCRHAWRALGGGMEDHPGRHLLHQSHAAARGAGKLARQPDGTHAAAPHADHLRDQRRHAEGGADEARRHGRVHFVGLAHRREWRPPRPHGPARLRGLAQHQRRLGPAHRPDEGDRVQELHTLFPDRINNKTNGITPRRWLKGANHGLTELLKSAIGDGFLSDAEQLQKAEPMAKDKSFRQAFAAVKRDNKAELSNLIAARMSIATDPTALFDVQIKRIHEYKRQLLNILETGRCTRRCVTSRRKTGYRG